MRYWETFKRQASEECAFATEYDTKDEIEKIEMVLKERERVLETICEIDGSEVTQILNRKNVNEGKNSWNMLR